MTENSALLMEVARNLRYRTLEQFIGESVTFDDRLQIAASAASFVARFVDERTFAGPGQDYLEGQIAKYDLLDLRFDAPPAMLDAAPTGGMPLLRELGFVDGGMQELAEELGGDSGGCLEALREKENVGQITVSTNIADV